MREWDLGGEPMVIRRALLEEILDLRYRVLIAGTARTSSEFAGDRAATTWHFGVFGHGRTVGCASLMRSELDASAAWQLRGMAVEEDLRGRGVGSALLRAIEDAVAAESPLRLFWCNARVAAVAFYERHGWRRISDEFMIEGVGLHHRMRRDLATLAPGRSGPFP